MGLTIVFAALLAIHGVIHLLGFAKAFGFAELSELQRPITPVVGVLWLVAAVLFVAAGVSLFVWPRGWSAIGAVAVVISLAVILPSWSDAKFGLIPNVVIVVGIALGFLTGRR